jgi:hypothetical protein
MPGKHMACPSCGDALDAPTGCDDCCDHPVKTKAHPVSTQLELEIYWEEKERG